MSTNSAGIHPSLQNHGLRLLIAVVGASVFGMVINDYLVVLLGPVIAAALLAPGEPAAPPGKLLVIPLIMWILGQAVLAVTALLASNTDVLVLVFTGFTFMAFYRDAVKGPDALIGLTLIVLVAISTFAATSITVAAILVDGLALGALAAALSTIFAHAVLLSKAEVTDKPEPEISRSPLRESIGRTAILMALFGYFVITEKHDSLYILITAVTVLRLPAAAQGAIGLIAANIIGGAISLFAAVFISTNPSELFGFILFYAMVLSLGLAAEAGGTIGALAKGATGISIILLVIALAPSDGSEAYFSRVVEIFLTAAFVLLGRCIVDAPPQDTQPATV
jgi:hypothetical protein